MNKNHQLTINDKILQKTPYILLMFQYGNSSGLPYMALMLIVAKPNKHKDVSYLANLISQIRYNTILHFIPSMINIFAHQLAIKNIIN